jgi:hypothetical protein|tara:strand:- start:255 stop:425 length:171 start_codon:yes stop_codon:yes gene_type:complete
LPDLPCGTGRFWDRLFLSGVQDLIAADYSQDMLNLATRVRFLEQVTLAATPDLIPV